GWCAWTWSRAAGCPSCWGAAGVQRPAEDGVQWRFLANRKLVTDRLFGWWPGYFAAHYEAPPAGFEPALTAPEAVGRSPHYLPRSQAVWPAGPRLVRRFATSSDYQL